MFPFDDGCRKLPHTAITAAVNIMQSMPQPCPPWILRAWPPLLWQVGRLAPPGLHHLSTQVTQTGDPAVGASGQTLWACKGDEGAVGLAWDWVQLHCGVVAMADPLAVVTNLRLVGDEGELLTTYESARHFSAYVHALPWQLAVERAVEQALAAGSTVSALASGPHGPAAQLAA
jgi:hypothetical protein